MLVRVTICVCVSVRLRCYLIIQYLMYVVLGVRWCTCVGCDDAETRTTAGTLGITRHAASRSHHQEHHRRSAVVDDLADYSSTRGLEAFEDFVCGVECCGAIINRYLVREVVCDLSNHVWCLSYVCVCCVWLRIPRVVIVSECKACAWRVLHECVCS